MSATTGAASAPDDFTNFQNGHNDQDPATPTPGGTTNGHHYDSEEYDEDIDFVPQNGYTDEMPPPVATGGKKEKPERQSREPIKMPKMEMPKMKRVRMPSPGEIVHGYLNSDFHNKNFKQPLACKTRVEDIEIMKARKLLTEQKTPAELGNLRHPLDIPLPKLRSSSNSKKADKEEVESIVEFDPRVKEGSKIYNTLPRSWRTQNLQTNCKEVADLDELVKRKELIGSKSPAELANISSLSDIPVPTKIKRMMSPSEKIIAKQKDHVDHVEDLPKEPFSLYGTLPRSWKEKNLVTSSVIEDEEVVSRHRALVETKSPAELSEFNGLGDFPVPTRIENIFKKSATNDEIKSEIAAPKNFSETMYATLPKSWKEQNLITQTEVMEDLEELAKRQKLTQEKTPAELAQISSLSDMPIPTALENFLKSDHGNGIENSTPRKPLTERLTLDEMYATLPKSLKEQNLITASLIEDPEVVAKNQEIVKSKTPAQLAQINNLDEFPIPNNIETLIKKRTLKSTSSKEASLNKSKSWTDLNNWSMPESMKCEVMVRSRVEDPEVQRERAEITKTRTVSQLSQINSLSEFPIPKRIENILTKKEADELTNGVAEDNRPLKEKLYDTLPRSMKAEVLVRVRDEDPEVQIERQELTRAKSPMELSQISSPADFPIPKNIENLLNKNKRADEGPTPPPRRFRKEDIYESLPASLKAEVLVRVRDEDPEVQMQRQELTRSKSPVELSQISSLSEFPIPKNIENMINKKKDVDDSISNFSSVDPDQGTIKRLYEKLPDNLKTEVLVRARQEHPDIQSARAEICKSKTVSELSQITSFDEFPLPKTVDQMIGRAPRPVERRKKFRMMQRSQSAKNMKEAMENVLPESMKAQVLVKARVEDPEIREFRRNLVESKSVSELSQISGLSDFPIPSTIERLMQSKGDVSAVSTPSFDINNIYATLPSSLKTDLQTRSRFEDPEIQDQRRQITQSKSVSELSQIQTLGDFPIPTTIEKLMQNRGHNELTRDATKTSIFSGDGKLEENIYATLPRSLKAEVLVRSRIEDPEVLATRQETVQSKSVGELAQLNSLSDFPLPTPIEKMIQGKTSLKMPTLESENQSGGYDIYASLPRSLKKEVLVRSKVEEDPDVLQARQAIVSSKSPAELSQIHSFSEVPIPKEFEAWMHRGDGEGGNKLLRSPSKAKSVHELSATIYDHLPQSLKEPVAVRSKIEDPELQQQRFELTRSKTPSQLAEMHTLGDIPIKGLWEGDRGRPHRRSLSARSSSIPRNKQELKDMLYNKMLPDSLKVPVVVRVCNEDPETLRKHQEIQQSKSVHELSKISNLNEMPLPLNIQLPDVPLPSLKSMIGVIARVPKRKPKQSPVIEHEDNNGGLYSTVSTPNPDRTYTDDEMLRYEMSSPESMAHREQDFDYEVIEAGRNDEFEFMQTQVPVEEDVTIAEDESSISVADHYKGTPPLKSKKKKRMSHEVPSDFQMADTTTPTPTFELVHDQASPTPPPRPLRGNSREISSEKMPEQNLANSPNKLAKSASGTSANTMSSLAEQFHSVRSHAGTLRSTTEDDQTLHSCAETLDQTMHSCADTLVGEDDLHSLADTLNDHSDDEFFDQMLPPDSRNSRNFDD